MDTHSVTWDLELARATLRRGSVRFVVVHAGRVVAQSQDPGLASLLHALDGLRTRGLWGGALADRVVGLAALCAAMWGGLGAVHGETVSEAAVEAAGRARFPLTWDRCVPAILSRDRGRQCPFEEAAAEALAHGGGVEEAVQAVRARMAGRSTAEGAADGAYP
jgi:hypothetical protein